MEGWIKIHRKLLDWEWYSDGDMLRVFLHLLLCATHGETRWHGIEVKRGQTLVSQHKIMEALHMSRQVIRTCMSKLQRTGEIVTKGLRGCSGYTLVTVCNYDKYQDCEQSSGNHLLTNTATNLSTNSLTNLNKRVKLIGSNSCANEKNDANQLTNQLSNHLPCPKSTNNTRNKNIINNNKSSSLRSDDSSNDFDGEKVDADRYMVFFNSELDKAKSIIPRLKSMTPTRRANIAARCREYGRESMAAVARNAAASDFLNGKNDNSWVASFTWIMRPSNFLKVLEGDYDNKNDRQERKDKRRGFEVDAVSAEEYKTSF